MTVKTGLLLGCFRDMYEFCPVVSWGLCASPILLRHFEICVGYINSSTEHLNFLVLHAQVWILISGKRRMWREKHLFCLADLRLSLKAVLVLLGGQCHLLKSSVLHESHFSRLLFIDCKLSYQRTYCHSSIKAETFCRTPYTFCLGSLLSSQALHTEDFVLLNPVSSSPSSQGGSDAAKRKIRRKKPTPPVSVLKHGVSPLLYITGILERISENGSWCSYQCLRCRIWEMNPVTTLVALQHALLAEEGYRDYVSLLFLPEWATPYLEQNSCVDICAALSIASYFSTLFFFSTPFPVEVCWGCFLREEWGIAPVGSIQAHLSWSLHAGLAVSPFSNTLFTGLVRLGVPD